MQLIVKFALTRYNLHYILVEDSQMNRDISISEEMRREFAENYKKLSGY